MLADCGLQVLGFSGLPWTYDNKQRGNRNIKVRLDRVLADSAWMADFHDAEVEHLVSHRSDHCPILLRYRKNAERVKGRSQRYEIMWEREPSLEPEIVAAWVACTSKRSLSGIAGALQEVMRSLRR